MNTPVTGLTLPEAPQVLPEGQGGTEAPAYGRRTAIAYPTAERLRTRTKRSHGAPADRLARAYAVEPSGCWRWTGSLTTQGYGHFSIDSVYYQAHRLLYILRFGADIPTGLFPDHVCRNRWCVNPDHLEPVTHQENIRRGVRTRLNPAEVRVIREELAAGLSQRAIGQAHGIDHSTVCRIARRQRWGDVDESPATVAA